MAAEREGSQGSSQAQDQQSEGEKKEEKN
uniref:Uncharacterized protein n=1 Tax=Bracon brevicornis TaxID=1563983 RepID=A0A6V7K7G5_9HYME